MNNILMHIFIFICGVFAGMIVIPFEIYDYMKNTPNAEWKDLIRMWRV